VHDRLARHQGGEGFLDDAHSLLLSRSGLRVGPVLEFGSIIQSPAQGTSQAGSILPVRRL